MKIWWNRCFVFICCFASCFSSSLSQISDEEYALMPNVFETDNYDSCMLLNEKALYCAVNYKLSPISIENPSKIWNIIKARSQSENHYRHDILRHFICVSKTCPNVKTYNATHPSFRTELNECYDDLFKDQGLKGIIEVIKCKKAGPIYQIDTLDWIMALVFFSYIGFVLAFTAYDYKKSHDVKNYDSFKESRGGKIIVTMSIMSNWNKLKSIPSGPDYERLKPVQGLRVYMSIIVILVHACVSQIGVPVSNTKFVEDINDSPDLSSDIPKRSQFLLSFHFMMSAWMLMSSTLKKYDKNEAIDLEFVIKSIIKRYIRLILTVSVVMAFFATWFRHIPFGPFFDGICEESERCRKNWWINFLFIQNHYDKYYMCHVITWYLAVEMQYYIIALFIFLIVFKKPSRIPVMVGFLLILNFIFAFLDHKRHNYSSALSGNPELLYRVIFNQRPQWHVHFANYHANAAGFIIGMGFGYVYHKRGDQKIFNTLVKKQVWAILSGSITGLAFIMPALIDVDATPVHSALWVATTRPLFSIGIGIFILGLSEGLGGWVKDFFSWYPLYALGKLSYCVYVCHTVFQNLRVGFMRHPGYVGYYTLVQTIASDVLLSFLGALFLSIFFELPSNEMANKIFEKKKKKTDKKTN